MSELETFSSREALYDEAAKALASAVHNGLSERGRASLALAGGTTPAPVYERLAKADLAWSRVTVLLTDERQVPADHPDSNERLLRETLMTDRAAAATFSPLQDALVGRF